MHWRWTYALILALPASTFAAGPAYHLTDLCNENLPFDINNSGQIVGEIQFAAGTYNAFLKAPVSGILDLGTLPRDTDSEAFSINSRSEVVGTSQTGDVYQPFVRRPNAALHHLPQYVAK